MLEVQKFLKGASMVQSPTRALASLKEQYGIKDTIWEDQLVVLNYCQIDSPKRHTITHECRSLVLEMGTWEVVSRSFDRFFNFGEEPCPSLNIKAMTAYEKVDGSLIGLFNYKDKWMYRTRSVIMPTGQINGWDVTWDQNIEAALGTNYLTRLAGFEDFTFIMELTSMENRVVTKYVFDGPMMTLLAVRHTEGFYDPDILRDYALEGIPEWRKPRMYEFSEMNDCLETAAALRGLEEGFVLYNPNGVPVCKVKNPAYVAAHHLRGDGLTPKRVMDLIIMNEVGEYLTIFPEDTKVFQSFQDGYNNLIAAVAERTHLCRDRLTTQKEFAMSILDLPYKSLLFSMRKGFNLKEAWELCSLPTKYKLIEVMKDD